MAQYSEGEALAIMAEELDVAPERLTREAKFREDLQADSLDLTEMVMKLEEAFDFDLPNEAVENLTTVGEALDLMAQQPTKT